MKDDWEKPRSRGTHFTDAEKVRLREAFDAGIPAREIARELQCSSRIAAGYYAQFACAGVLARTLQPKRRPVSRFYKTDFEL